MNLDGKSIYKYILGKKVLTCFYSYSPKSHEEILKMTYEQLIFEQEKEEACRRQNLFEKVSRFLKRTPESICDESLQYLSTKANVPVEEIIAYIEETELAELTTKANLSVFSTIKRSDIHFLSERSIRELCGVNIREAEASKAMGEIDEELSCYIEGTIFKDPVMCSSGHTYERAAIERWIKESWINNTPHHATCPTTREGITNWIAPNYALKKVLDKFVEKYENQKGDIWEPIVKLCMDYKNYPEKRLMSPVEVHVPDESEIISIQIEERMREREKR